MAQLINTAPSLPLGVGVLSISFDTANIEVHGAGGDQWPITWGTDGLYTLYGDGVGWNEAEALSTMGITRVTTNPPNPTATDLWNETTTDFKPHGIIANESNRLEIFYDTSRDSYDSTRYAFSTDSGVSITDKYSDGALFTHSTDGAIVVGVAQFGSGYSNLPSHAPSTHYYVYLSNRDDTDQAGTDVWLARVVKANVGTRASYEFWTGVSNDVPSWSSTWANRVAVFTDAAGMAYHASVVWNPYIQKFIYSKFHKTGSNWILCMYDGPRLWGPWHNFHYSSSGLPDPTYRKFTVQTPQKWMSAPGGNQQSIWLTYSGHPELDAIRLCPATLQLGGAVTVTQEWFNLQVSSPAINAGANAGVAEDIHGVVRPQGSAPDIGSTEEE